MTPQIIAIREIAILTTSIPNHFLAPFYVCSTQSQPTYHISRDIKSDLIAGSFESCDGDIELWVEAIELVYDELGLSERERRAAGAQTQGCWSLTGHDADSSVRAQRKPSPLPSLRVLGEGVGGEASWLGQFL